MITKTNFCQNELLLEPENTSFLSLFCLLCSFVLGEKSFVFWGKTCSYQNSKHEQRDKLQWLQFISLLVQKIFLLCRKPMALVGNTLEMWLNLLSNNGGFLMLPLTILRGRMVWPDRSSATFTSVMGNLDKRLELDKTIRHGNRSYNASLALMAAKLSYENEAFIRIIVKDRWHMEFLGFFNFYNEYHDRPSTPAFVLQDVTSDPNLIVVAFRGTGPFDARGWCTDVDISWHELEGIGKIHRGFMKALGLTKHGWSEEIERGLDKRYAYHTIRKMLRDNFHKNEKAKFILTGHSLGGALAILFVFVLILHEEVWLLMKLEGVYTFGQPRVGDKQFGEFMKTKLKKYNVKYLRYVYCNDMVPKLPYDDDNLFFNHFAPCLHYNSCYEGEIRQAETSHNYFSLSWAIPKYLIALWELIRSFIIPYMKGSDYREGWLMRLFMVIGLVIPGLPAHCLQDYNNSVRSRTLPKPVDLQL
ncbi:hypothetical protein P3X46_002289 [Hevea brasiliensis]|uniref:Fungal lipase-type domain-containing protein n=1 Tax=Hevea brasiliensis TaxID=3981 RepID=A0ABQ9N2G1_HEVBR|nr:hypothetical protein P3X46_002289 [Hevea brasiliensis]